MSLGSPIEFNLTGSDPLQQWTKVVAEAASGKDLGIFWDGQRSIKLQVAGTVADGYNPLTIQGVWRLTEQILQDNPSHPLESGTYGIEFIQRFKSLMPAEEERLRVLLSSSTSQNQKLNAIRQREFIRIQAEVKDLEVLLSSSSSPQSKYDLLTRIFKENNVALLQKWIALGGDLNQLINGKTPLNWAMIYNARDDILKVLISGSDIFKMNTQDLSAFDYCLYDLINQMPLSSIADGSRASLFVEKIAAYPDKPTVAFLVNRSLSSLISNIPLSPESMGHFLALIEMLKPIGADPDAIQIKGAPLFQTVFRALDFNSAKILKGMGADISTAGFTDFMFSVWMGDVEAVKKTIEFSGKEGSQALVALIDETDILGNTALTWSLISKRDEITKLLIEAKADVNVMNFNGFKPLDYASGPISTLLEDAGAKDKTGCNKLMKLIIHGDEKGARALIESGFDVNALSDDRRSVLHFAASNGFPELVEFLVDIKKFNINAQDVQGITALMLAVYEEPGDEHDERIQTVRMLLDLEAELNIKDHGGKTAFDVATQGSEIERELNIEGALDSRGYNAVMRAIRDGDEELLDEVLAMSDLFDLNQVGTDGATALSLAAQYGNFAALNKLLDLKADPNLGNPTPLQVLLNYDASRMNDTVTLQADILRNIHGAQLIDSTELMYAVWFDNVEAAGKQLAALPAETKQEEMRKALLVALRLHRLDMVKLLIDHHLDVNYTEPGLGRSLPPVSRVIEYEDIELVELLLKAGGANVNMSDSTGYTPLMYALRCPNKVIRDKLFELVMSFGPDCDMQNNQRQTALHMALMRGDPDDVIRLIPLTNPNLKDIQGNTPLHAAFVKSSQLADLFLTAAGTHVMAIDHLKVKGALFWAVYTGNLKFIKNLAENAEKYGLDLNVENDGRLTIIEYIDFWTSSNRREIESTPPPVPDRVRVLLDALKNLQEMRTTLIAAGAINERGQTPLISAVCDKIGEAAVDAVKACIAKGIDLNAMDYQGRTAAICAAILGKKELVKLLRESGSGIMSPDERGHTAFYYLSTFEKLELLGPKYREICNVILTAFDKGLEKQFDEFRRTLTSQDVGQVLVLPLYSNSRPMAQAIWKALTEEEWASGLRFLHKLFPRVDLTWIKECHLDFVPEHYTAVADDMAPPAPAGFDIFEFVRLFDQINTTDASRPDYFTMKRFNDPDAPKTWPELRNALVQFLTRVKEKNKQLGGSPPPGPDLVAFYQKTENDLADILPVINSPSYDPIQRAKNLCDIAVTYYVCGIGTRDRPAEVRSLVKGDLAAETVTVKIPRLLKRKRDGVVEHMTLTATDQFGRRIPKGNQFHTKNQIVRTLSDCGLTGAGSTEADQKYALSYLNRDLLKDRFDRDYTPSAAITRIYDAVNGTFDSQGYRMAGSQEVDQRLVDEWWIQQMPPEWEQKEHQSFIVQVKKEWEAEEKRLASFAEQGINKLAKATIRNFLRDVYNITLPESVDLQDWEQVKDHIPAENTIVPGARRLIERDAIKAFIANRSNREKYATQALRSFLIERHNIQNVPNPRNWRDVLDGIEARRGQEYLKRVVYKNEGFKDKDGRIRTIPRENIAEMLVRMKILSVMH